MSFRKQENREIRSLAGGGYNSVPSTVARCYDFRKPGGYLGNVGSNAKGVGAGVFECRIDVGPGYRVYFGKDGDNTKGH